MYIPKWIFEEGKFVKIQWVKENSTIAQLNTDSKTNQKARSTSSKDKDYPKAS